MPEKEIRDESLDESQSVLDDHRIINGIPSSRQLRERMGQILRELEILRGLLKVAERAEKEKGTMEGTKSKVISPDPQK